jgi:hypothetical protein
MTRIHHKVVILSEVTKGNEVEGPASALAVAFLFVIPEGDLLLSLFLPLPLRFCLSSPKGICFIRGNEKSGCPTFATPLFLWLRWDTLYL